jgi:4'-phosphopantetheinyl transferase
VAIWSVPLDVEAADLQRFRALLDADEQSRADRFAFDRDTSRFIAAHGWLRRLLADWTGSPATSFRFEPEPGTTKPRLVAPPPLRGLRFNLTHSADRALVAIGESAAPIGIDLERADPTTDVDQVALRFFSPAERERLAAFPPGPPRLDVFYRCWTRKEAVLKGVGTGLQTALEDFDVDLTTSHPFPVHGRREAGRLVRGWTIEPLSLDPGWAGALAIRPSARTPVDPHG